MGGATGDVVLQAESIAIGTQQDFSAFEIMVSGISGGASTFLENRITPAGSTGKVGPAASIPENPGAFLERGVFQQTEGVTYLVRAGPAGRYGDFLFNSLSEAKSYAQLLASTGETAIKNTSALPNVWPSGTSGNPVNEINVFGVSPFTNYIGGVVGPQIEAGTVYGTPKVYSGGGPQVVIDLNAQLNQVATYPVLNK
jgi:hypothetical protein